MDNPGAAQRWIGPLIRRATHLATIILVLCAVYVGSFGPVSAVGIELADRLDPASSERLFNGLEAFYTPLVTVAGQLRCESILGGYSNWCQRAISGNSGLIEDNSGQPDERVREVIRDSLGDRSPEEVAELWR